MRSYSLAAVCLALAHAFRPVLRPTTGLRPAAARHRRALRAAELDAAATMPARSEVTAPPTKGKLGIMLLNLGGPERLEDVKGFLYNLFADPDIIRLPPALGALQSPLAWAISTRRSPVSEKAYASIGGGSPLARYTREQGAALEKSLVARGYNSSCYVAMRYWAPFTEQALADAAADGVDYLVVLPLYPHFSISTTGSSMRVLGEQLVQDYPALDQAHTVLPAWYNRLGYVDAMAKLIVKDVVAASAKTPPVHILFSAHGVPRNYIDDAGDPYQRHIEECVNYIASAVASLAIDRSVPPPEFHLSYQSRVGPIEWLRPYTDDKIVELGVDLGVRNLVVVPISFVSEHIETLEEIDIEYRELAEENGIEHWSRVPALGADPDFIEDLADSVEQALSEPALSISEACVLNNCDLRGDEEDDPALSTAPVGERLNGRIAMLGLAALFTWEAVYNRAAISVFSNPPLAEAWAAVSGGAPPLG